MLLILETDLCFEDVVEHFLVVEMMLHAFDFLIVFVAFSCNKHHISTLCHHASRSNGLLTVDDRDDFPQLLVIQSGQHIVDNRLRFLETGIVTGDDNPVTLPHSFLCHKGPFALITVATCATYGDDMTLSVEHFVYGIEHICQCIRRMGIVNDGRKALG